MNATESPVTPPAAGLHYRDPRSIQTLAEGLAELRGAVPGLLDEGRLPEDARQLFHNHDIAHVVFGCDTSLVQEGMVDLWTIFGSTVGLRAYLSYMKTDEAKQVLRDVGLGRALWATLKALPRLAGVIVRARRMTRKWPWTDHDAYLDRPLVEIREEFGIVLPAA